MNSQPNNQALKQSQFYRFQVLQARTKNDGASDKPRSVGMAYLKEGQNTYTLRLWMLLNEKFYIIPNKNDSSRFLILTREPNKNPLGKNKYFWNIVGNGKADTSTGYVSLDFDLLDKPILMSLYPESSANSVTLPDPNSTDVA
jgi:hypothetical protein